MVMRWAFKKAEAVRREGRLEKAWSWTGREGAAFSKAPRAKEGKSDEI